MDTIIPTTSALDKLEAEIKAKLRRLDSVDAAAEMASIQVQYAIAYEEFPDWTERQIKAYVFKQWLQENQW